MTAGSERIARWRADPLLFVRENFKVEPDAWQAQVLTGIKPVGINRACMKACAGPGKTAVLAWLGWQRLSCFAAPGEHPKGAAVSITADNLRDNLWPELAKWQQRSPFLTQAFTWQKERIFANDHEQDWFLSFRSFSKSADATEHGRVLSGLHSRYPFVLLDESGDMSPSIGLTAEQAMGGCETGLIAQAGNTTSMGGLLYDSAVTNAIKWLVVTITADPDDPNRTPRVSVEWAREQIAKYGRTNPWVQAFVLGEFPAGGMNTLMSLAEVEAAMKRMVREEDLEMWPKIMGNDVARFGDDRTTIYPRQGPCAFKPVIMRNARTTEIAARVAKGYTDWGADAVCVDGTGGYGAGVVDQLQQVPNITVFEVQFAGVPNDPRYFNKRTEMWFELAEWVKRTGCLPDNPTLKAELTAPTYYFQNGKIRLEEKDQIKKRLGWSPDEGDGLALTFAVAMPPKTREIRKALTDIEGGASLARYLEGGIVRAKTNRETDDG